MKLHNLAPACAALLALAALAGCSAESSAGIVTEVDSSRMQITIARDGIVQVFKVQDRTVLEAVKTSETIAFDYKRRDRDFVMTAIRK